MATDIGRTHLHTKLDATNDLTNALIDLWHRIDSKSITLSEARTKSLIARELLNVKRIEMMATRVGMTSFEPVSFAPLKVINSTNKEDDAPSAPTTQT